MPQLNRIEFLKLYDAALELSAASQQQETYREIVSQAKELVGGKFASLFFLSNGSLKRVCATDDRLYAIEPRPQGNTFTVFTQNTPYLLHTSQFQDVHPTLRELKVASDISIPLAHGDTVVGVLSVLSDHEHEFTEHHLHVLSFFGPLAALAIQNARYSSQVEQTLKDQDFFLSIASHELKTPLTSLKLYSEMLAKQASKPEQVRALSEKLLHATSRLSKLVEELLQIDRMKRGTLSFQLEPTNLHSLLQKAAEEFSHSYPNHPLEYVSQAELVYIHADEHKLLQVFTNLLNNAGKFSHPGSPIQLQLKEEIHQAVVTVTDHGEGISEANVRRIFDRFYKVEKKNPSSGMGLGLYLVKHIVESHRGKIHVKSKPSQGTTFTVRFPLTHD